MIDQIFVNTLIFLQRFQPKAFCKQNTFTKGNEKINLIWCRRKKWNAYMYYNVGIYTSIKLMRICGNANKSFQCLSFYKEIYQRLSCRQILVSALIPTLTFTTNFVFQVNKFQLLWIPNGQKYKVYERIKFA